ncbi:hypothetical protein PLESTF_000004900 [Pleodorina starrii]|nr:hypothetical protein PLESTF_000004900 [Pleodorina starrii]
MDAAAPTDVVYQDSTVAADPAQTPVPRCCPRMCCMAAQELRHQGRHRLVCWNGRRCANRCGLPRFHRRCRSSSNPRAPLLPAHVLHGCPRIASPRPAPIGLLEWTPLRQQMWFTKIPPSLQIQLKPPCPAVARACAAWLPKNCVTKAGTDWSAGMDAAAPTDVVYQDSTVAADPGLLEWTPLRQQMWFIKIPPSLQIQARCQEKREAEDAGHAVRDTPPRP